MNNVHSHRELMVYQKAFAAACAVLRLTTNFPATERYDLIAQVRKSCRSVCANLAEAWRKRIYPASFISKLVDCEGEAAETQVWMEFALAENYVAEAEFNDIFEQYEVVLKQLVSFRRQAQKWTAPNS